MARYSGEAISRTENEARTGHYRIKISNNLYLDAENSHHFEGRYINDGVRAGKKANVRFAAGYKTNKCSTTGFDWIRIFAIRDIKPGEELYLDYGDEFWINIERPHPPPRTSLSPINHKSKPDKTPAHTTYVRNTPHPTTITLGSYNNSPAHSRLSKPTYRHTILTL